MTNTDATTARVRISLSPRWFLLDGTLNLWLDGRLVFTGSLAGGLQLEEIVLQPGTHSLSSVLMGVARRDQSFEFDVAASGTTVLELDYSRITGLMKLRVLEALPVG